VVAVSGGFSVEGRFRPFGRRIKQSQRDPNYTQPAHIRPPCAGERGGYQLGISGSLPPARITTGKRGTRHHQTGYDCQPPITGIMCGSVNRIGSANL